MKKLKTLITILLTGIFIISVYSLLFAWIEILGEGIAIATGIELFKEPIVQSTAIVIILGTAIALIGKNGVIDDIIKTLK